MKRSTVAPLAGFSVGMLVTTLVAIKTTGHHTASPVAPPSPIASLQSHSPALASVAPALPTPSPTQARRKALRPTPASRSRTLPPQEGLPAILVRIRGCESGDGPTDPGDYSNVNPESGASGAFQFLDSTWHYVTHLPGKARDYSRATQDWGAIKLYRSEGTRPWNSSRYCWS